MSKKVAVMDLGTNTFHLLIAEGDAADPTVLFRQTIPTRLGEGGINKGIIQPIAYERGIKAMEQFHEHIVTHNADEVKATATSALRNASNGKDFINEVKQKTGIVIELINGDSEAGYIYHGVKAGGCLSKENSLIVDIGGGSVEFILGNCDGIIWKQSLEIGAARMMDKFHRTDPISGECIEELNAYLDGKLTDLFAFTSNYTIANIIGSSGSFETFAEVTELRKGNPFNFETTRVYHFDNADFTNTTDYLIHSTHDERASNKAIIPIRVDMIVVSSLITRFVMQKLNISAVIMSTNSLKEGVLASILSA